MRWKRRQGGLAHHQRVPGRAERLPAGQRAGRGYRRGAPACGRAAVAGALLGWRARPRVAAAPLPGRLPAHAGAPAGSLGRAPGFDRLLLAQRAQPRPAPARLPGHQPARCKSMRQGLVPGCWELLCKGPDFSGRKCCLVLHAAASALLVRSLRSPGWARAPALSALRVRRLLMSSRQLSPYTGRMGVCCRCSWGDWRRTARCRRRRSCSRATCGGRSIPGKRPSQMALRQRGLGFGASSNCTYMTAYSGKEGLLSLHLQAGP